MYIVLTILMFGLLIFIHELGHFTMARVFKVPVKEFSIGMGPKILSRTSKKYGTVYALRLFPFGGYVSMEGEGEESESEDSYSKKPNWQRVLILLAGPTMNILLAIVMMFGLVASSEYLLSTTVGAFMEGSVSSDEGGLQLKDKIVKVGWVPVFSGDELIYEISMQGSEPVDLTVIRNGEEVVLHDVKFGVVTEKGVSLGTCDFRVYAEEKTVGNCLKQAATRSVSSFKMVIDSLGGLLSGKFGIDAVQGPVGVTGEIQELENQGLMSLSSFVYLAVIISMNLGVFNLLPIPALDGGQILFRAVEAIRGGKPIKPETENAINGVMLMLLLIFSVFIMIKDIVGLFGT